MPRLPTRRQARRQFIELFRDVFPGHKCGHFFRDLERKIGIEPSDRFRHEVTNTCRGYLGRKLKLRKIILRYESDTAVLPKQLLLEAADAEKLRREAYQVAKALVGELERDTAELARKLNKLEAITSAEYLLDVWSGLEDLVDPAMKEPHPLVATRMQIRHLSMVMKRLLADWDSLFDMPPPNKPPDHALRRLICDLAKIFELETRQSLHSDQPGEQKTMRRRFNCFVEMVLSASCLGLAGVASSEALKKSIQRALKNRQQSEKIFEQ